MLNEKALIDIDEEDTTTRARNSMVDDHGENHMAEGELIAKGRHKTKGIPRRSQEAKDAEHVKDQLSDLPLWEPWFIHTMTIVQLVVLCVMLFHSFGRDEFAKWGIRTTPTSVQTCPRDLLHTLDLSGVCLVHRTSVTAHAFSVACSRTPAVAYSSPPTLSVDDVIPNCIRRLCNASLWGDCPTMFDGKTADRTASRVEGVNPWLGPDSAYGSTKQMQPHGSANANSLV